MKQHAPAAERNKGPLLEVLRRLLPARGLVLEVASGTGQHAVHFARALPGLRFQPSDVDPAALASIQAYREEAGLENLAPPLRLDVRETPWPLDHADALVCINLLHIAPWEVTVALFRGAAAILPPGAPLLTYGPYRRDGRHTAPSNADFDAALRARNPAWGVRDLEAVVEVARDHGFDWEEAIPMPANNFTLRFHRARPVAASAPPR
ncbi:MAG: DUF938 domain-containing protein [Deltaproteobacteria bacterium]|nr:MAG: DUF938 domain-containing protein [Deltaproteobacteria bacterium]